MNTVSSASGAWRIAPAFPKAREALSGVTARSAHEGRTEEDAVPLTAPGGEELGGERGLRFYMQRTALQGDRALLSRALGLAPDASAEA